LLSVGETLIKLPHSVPKGKKKMMWTIILTVDNVFKNLLMNKLLCTAFSWGTLIKFLQGINFLKTHS
jgi:hypothetical protein